MNRQERLQLGVILALALCALIGLIVITQDRTPRLAAPPATPRGDGWRVLTPAFWSEDYARSIMIEGQSTAKQLELLADGKHVETQSQTLTAGRWRFLVDAEKYPRAKIEVRERFYNGTTKTHLFGVIPPKP